MDSEYDIYKKGHDDGRAEGHEVGYEEGHKHGYDKGFGDGHDEGFDEGFDEGKEEGKYQDKFEFIESMEDDLGKFFNFVESMYKSEIENSPHFMFKFIDFLDRISDGKIGLIK